MSLPRFIYVLVLSLLFVTVSPDRVLALPDATMNVKQLKVMEDSLVNLADSMSKAPIPDFRTGYCEDFIKVLVRTLKMPGSYSYPFDSLRSRINIIAPEDNSFKIFNWAIAYSDVRLRYYAAIQMKGDELKLYPLYDNSDLLSKANEDSVLNARHWIGCLFYNIITKKVDGENIYCMFGMNDANPISTKKIIDPMYFTDKGPMFGAPVFAIASEKNPSASINRFILEYKKDVQVVLNWDESLGAILYDDLVSQINDPNRKYTYIPTGQYNGLRWSQDKWHAVQDLIPVQNLKDGEAPSGDK